jgi:transposase
MGKQATRLRRTFTPQFKKDAVRLVTEEGKSLTEVATHLGIARSLLQRWREQLSSKPAPEVFPGHGLWTAVINGFLAPPVLVVVMLIANNKTVMGERVNGLWTNVGGWLTTGVMFAAAIGLVLCNL